MNILVTGGAGYIGSHVLKQLGEAGHNIVVIDNLSTGRKESMLYGEHLEISLEQINLVEKAFEEFNFDACVHFAGSIVVPESVEKPIKYYKNNTENSLELIRLCKAYGVNKFIFSSTAAVYGDNATDGVCTEQTSMMPLNPYGRSKMMTEMMLEDTAASSDLNYVALRYFNVAGANVDLKIGQCTPNATHLIKIASECAAGKRQKMSVFGDDYATPDGTCIRDYIHVDDLARAHVDALNYLEKGGKSDVFNCGYGRGFSVNEVIDTVKRVSGSDFKVETVGRRAGDASKLISRADKIKEALGWKPKHDDLDLIVHTAFEWEKKLGELNG